MNGRNVYRLEWMARDDSAFRAKYFLAVSKEAVARHLCNADWTVECIDSLNASRLDSPDMLTLFVDALREIEIEQLPIVHTEEVD